MQLFKHQIDVLEQTKEKNRVAYYLDMGLGKTFVASEKMMDLNSKVNIVVCQKSKVSDWVKHFEDNYGNRLVIWDATIRKNQEVVEKFCDNPTVNVCNTVIVINYELLFRRKSFQKLKDFTLILDESSMIQNEKAKRTKFIMKMNPSNVILLSGTCVNGKYENLWSQCQLLGWNISKRQFWNDYIQTRLIDVGGNFMIPIVTGYKNIRFLKEKLREYGAVFMKTEDVLDLPEQIETNVFVDSIPAYKRFMKHSIVEIDGQEIVGDNSLTKMLYARQICGQYNKNKLEALKELIESTDDRLIIFYNFNMELDLIKNICRNRPVSIINGETKDLKAYEESDNAIVLIQYQAGAYGLNLQKANKIIYFTLPLSSELFEQSKKRTHRIGQTNTCFYYYMISKDTIEEDIFATLKMRKDFTDYLFKQVVTRHGKRKEL